MTSVIPGTGKIGLSSQIGRLKFARALYDFAVEGGAISTITLRGDKIPASAIVVDAFIEVDTAVTSGGAATVSIGVEAAADLRAADALATAPALSTAGTKRSAVRNGSTNPTKTTALRSVSIVVGTAALTAGKFSVVLAYVELT